MRQSLAKGWGGHGPTRVRTIQIALTDTRRGGADNDSKQRYGEEDIAALMGFSHVKKGSKLQDIWTYLHTMRSKNIDVCRRQPIARMNRWAHDRHISIDTSVYLEGTTIKAIMELK